MLILNEIGKDYLDFTVEIKRTNILAHSKLYTYKYILFLTSIVL